MSKVTLDYSKTAGFVSSEEISYMGRLTEEAKNQLVSKSGAGNEKPRCPAGRMGSVCGGA